MCDNRIHKEATDTQTVIFNPDHILVWPSLYSAKYSIQLKPLQYSICGKARGGSNAFLTKIHLTNKGSMQTWGWEALNPGEFTWMRWVCPIPRSRSSWSIKSIESWPSRVDRKIVDSIDFQVESIELHCKSSWSILHRLDSTLYRLDWNL